MKFIVDGKDYIVKFRYQRRNPRARVHTFCEVGILKPDGEIEHVANGEAVCDSRDRFVKSKGRKESMTDALMTNETPSSGTIVPVLAKVSRAARTAIWNQYFATTHELAK